MKVIAIYPGRFQPPGPHHAKAYEWLASQFGRENTFVVTSDKTEPGKSPFTFNEKARMFYEYNIDNIGQVKNPYKAEELTRKFDPNTTAVVYMYGKKDAGRIPFTKKDGTPGYLQPFTGVENMLPMAKHGYVIEAPHINMRVAGKEMSGTTLREVLAKTTPEQFKQIMGWFDQKLYNLIKSKLYVNESKKSNLDESFSKNWWKRVFEYINEEGDLNEDQLNERKQVGTIYHYTSLRALASILSDDELVGRLDYNSHGGSNAAIRTVSFTRDKNFYKGRTESYIDGAGVRLAVDGDRLSDNYKIEPHDDTFTSRAMDYTHPEYGDEMEERVVLPGNKHQIQGIIKYITNINFDADESTKNPRNLLRLEAAYAASDSYPWASDILELLENFGYSKPLSTSGYTSTVRDLITNFDFTEEELTTIAMAYAADWVSKNFNIPVTGDIQITSQIYRKLENIVPTIEKRNKQYQIENINEVGEGTAKIYDWNDDTDEVVSNYKIEYSFNDDSNDTVNVELFTKGHNPENRYVSFTVNGDYNFKTTNKGNVFRIMATIVDIMKDALNKYDITTIYWKPKLETGEISGSSKRDKLYMAYVKKQIPDAKVSMDGKNIKIELEPEMAEAFSPDWWKSVLEGNKPSGKLQVKINEIGEGTTPYDIRSSGVKKSKNSIQQTFIFYTENDDQFSIGLYTNSEASESYTLADQDPNTVHISFANTRTAYNSTNAGLKQMFRVVSSVMEAIVQFANNLEQEGWKKQINYIAFESSESKVSSFKSSGVEQRDKLYISYIGKTYGVVNTERIRGTLYVETRVPVYVPREEDIQESTLNEIGDATAEPYEFERTYVGAYQNRTQLGVNYYIVIPDSDYDIVAELQTKTANWPAPGPALLDISFNNKRVPGRAPDKKLGKYSPSNLGLKHMFRVMVTLGEIIKDYIETLKRESIRTNVVGISFIPAYVKGDETLPAHVGERQRQKLYNAFITKHFDVEKVETKGDVYLYFLKNPLYSYEDSEKTVSEINESLLLTEGGAAGFDFDSIERQVLKYVG